MHSSIGSSREARVSPVAVGAGAQPGAVVALGDPDLACLQGRGKCSLLGQGAGLQSCAGPTDGGGQLAWYSGFPTGSL